MKKNILKISAILGLCLVAFVGIAQTQKTGDDDDKKKKKTKIEKRVEVEQENGETTVTITTIKDGKKTVEKLTGDDAQVFLDEHAHEGGEGEDIEIRIDMSGSHSAMSQEGTTSKRVEVNDINGEKVVKVVTIKDGEETVEEYRGAEADEYLENQHEKMGHTGMHQFKFDFSDMEGMDMDTMNEKLKEMMSQMEGNAFSFDFDTEGGEGKGDMDVKIFMDGDDIPEDMKKMLEEMDINLDQLMEEAKGSGKTKVMVTTMVMVEDVENEEGEADLELDAFELFPNPSEGQLRIKFDTGNEKEATVTVRDLNGKEVYKNRVEGATNYELTVDLGEEASGTYIVTVDQDKKRKSKKLILK